MLVRGLRAHLDRKQQIRGAGRCNVLKTWICPRKAGIQLISLGPRFLLLSMLWLRAAETLFQSRHLRKDVSAKFSGLAFSPPLAFLLLKVPKIRLCNALGMCALSIRTTQLPYCLQVVTVCVLLVFHLPETLVAVLQIRWVYTAAVEVGGKCTWNKKC